MRNILRHPDQESCDQSEMRRYCSNSNLKPETRSQKQEAKNKKLASETKERSHESKGASLWRNQRRNRLAARFVAQQREELRGPSSTPRVRASRGRWRRRHAALWRIGADTSRSMHQAQESGKRASRPNRGRRTRCPLRRPASLRARRNVSRLWKDANAKMQSWCVVRTEMPCFTLFASSRFVCISLHAVLVDKWGTNGLRSCELQNVFGSAQHRSGLTWKVECAYTPRA